MIDRMNPADSIPMPFGAPWKSGPITHTLPRVRPRKGWIVSAKNGANTNSPHMP
jgi:hypothetical protein